MSFKKNTIATSYYEHTFCNVILVQITEEFAYGKTRLLKEIHKLLYSLNIDRQIDSIRVKVFRSRSEPETGRVLN